MEDGIERSSLNLHTNKTDKEVIEKINDLLYVYIPEGREWEDFIITNNREKAVELIKKNKGRIEIFKKDFLVYINQLMPVYLLIINIMKIEF